MRRLVQLFLSALLGLSAFAAHAGAPAPCKPGENIRDERFVSIGGIEQWVAIKGDDCRNPVLLIVHGGPGNPLSPYMDALYAGWEREFTLVTWDQRGAGRTYSRNPVAPETEEQVLSFKLLAQDGLELAGWAAQRLGKRRVILFGGSWGSALAVHMASGEDFSWLQYVGMGGKGMSSTLDLYELGPAFQMPVFMVQGAAGLVTVPEVARRYFDTIEAPRKEFFLPERVGHDQNPAMIAAQLEILRTRARALAD